jgi:Viral BACON domain
MDQFLMDRCLPRFGCAVAAFVLFAGYATADATPPLLVSFSISPLSVDTSAGAATLNVFIAAQDNSNGFGANAAGNGSISLALQSGTTVFSRQSLPMTGGTSTNPIFQFGFTVPQFSPSGVYSIGITLVDNASNTSIFTAATLQAMGFPSAITVTNSAFGSITVSPSAANVPASGGSGSLAVTASNSGFTWSASSNASWLTIVSGASGTGNGSINYFAAMNNAPAPRTGIITASGQTFTATQAAASSALNTTAGSLQFTYQVGGAAPAPQTITAFSSGAPLNFTATASSVGNWLFVSPASGVTSTVLSVFVNPVGLSAGVYTGSVTVSAGGSSNGSQTEAVTLSVSAGQQVTITPGTLSFSYQQGGSAAPPQSLTVSAGAPTAFTASASSTGGWLTVNPSSSTPPSTLAVSIVPSGLAPGTYGGSVAISSPAGVQNIPVTLVVAASSNVAVSPSSLVFQYTIGDPVPASQSLFFSGGPSGSSFIATASSGGNWLTLGALAAPGGVGVSVNPLALGAGVYTGAR